MTDLGDVMLSLERYADTVGASTRTVMRWLKAGEVPGAGKDESGVWQIPASARRVPGGVGGAGPVHTPAPFPQAAMTYHPSRVPVHPAYGQALAVVPEPDDEPDLVGEPLLMEELDDLPAFLTVAQAARFLGVPQAQIVANAQRFQAEPIGVQGSLRVPQRVVRRIAGL